MRPTLLALTSLLLPLASLAQRAETIHYGDLDIDIHLPGAPLHSEHGAKADHLIWIDDDGSAYFGKRDQPDFETGSNLGHTIWVDGVELAVPGKRDLPDFETGSNLGHTIWVDGVELAIPGKRDVPTLETGSNLGHTIWVDGVELAVPGKRSIPGATVLIDGIEIALPGKRHLPLSYPPHRNSQDDAFEHGEKYFHPRAAAASVAKRAPPPGRLFGDTGLPHWTDPRQNESVASCGLTSAMQALSYILPELVAANMFIEENAPLNAAGAPESVLVGVTNWNVLPLVKSAVTVEKKSLNSTNMMATDIWWPGAFEKAIEALGQNTTYMLSSRAMTMISGLDASFNLTTNSGFSTKQGATGPDETWAVLARCRETPVTVQTFWNVTGELQINHVFTVLKAEVVNGVKMLTLHNPHGWDNVLEYDKAWPQLYMYSYLAAFPTRADFGLGEIVGGAPYVPVPPPVSGLPLPSASQPVVRPSPRVPIPVSSAAPQVSSPPRDLPVISSAPAIAASRAPEQVPKPAPVQPSKSAASPPSLPISSSQAASNIPLKVAAPPPAPPAPSPAEAMVTIQTYPNPPYTPTSTSTATIITTKLDTLPSQPPPQVAAPAMVTTIDKAAGAKTNVFPQLSSGPKMTSASARVSAAAAPSATAVASGAKQPAAAGDKSGQVLDLGLIKITLGRAEQDEQQGQGAVKGEEEKEGAVKPIVAVEDDEENDGVQGNGTVKPVQQGEKTPAAPLGEDQDVRGGGEVKGRPAGGPGRAGETDEVVAEDGAGKGVKSKASSHSKEEKTETAPLRLAGFTGERETAGEGRPKVSDGQGTVSGAKTDTETRVETVTAGQGDDGEKKKGGSASEQPGSVGEKTEGTKGKLQTSSGEKLEVEKGGQREVAVHGAGTGGKEGETKKEGKDGQKVDEGKIGETASVGEKGQSGTNGEPVDQVNAVNPQAVTEGKGEKGVVSGKRMEGESRGRIGRMRDA